MPATDVCPNANEWERLQRGALSVVDADRLNRHSERCERCAALRAQMFVQPGAEPPLADSRTQASATTLPPQALPDSSVHFLDPARAVGELGWLAHYRVLKQLGQGGMGLVFLAEDTHLARPVALKVMQPALAADAANRDRFLREARAAAAITHDHIITIYQVSEANGAPFLAMQLLQGESLDDYLKRGKAMAAGHVCRVGRETALGLGAAHAKGLVHRDIKPANLWLEAPRGRIKILDFGLARGAGDPHLTGTGMVLGTPSFMAPEQARGQPIDGRCDLWSLGVVLYRICAGRLPFTGSDMLATLSSIALDEPPPLRELAPDTPSELATLVAQLLSKVPDNRPKTAREVADRLLQIERGLAKTAKTSVVTTANDDPTQTEAIPQERSGPTPARRAPGRRKAPSAGRWRVAISVACGSLAALVLGGGYLLWNRNTPSDSGGATAKLTSPLPVMPDDPPVNLPVVEPVVEARRGGPRPEPPPEGRRPNPPATVPAVRALTSSKKESGFASAPLVLEYIRGGQTLVVVDRESVSLRDMAAGTYRPPQPIGEAMRRAYKGTIAHAALAADGRTLALAVHTEAAGTPHRLVIWDVVYQREKGPLPTSIRYDALAFQADRPLLAASTDGEIRLWDLSKPLQESRIGKLTEANVTDLAFSPKEPVLAIGRSNGQVRLWDMAQNKERWRGATQPSTAVQGLTFSPDGRWLVATTLNEKFVRIWDATTGQVHVNNTVGMGKRLAISPNGRFLAIGSTGLNGSDNRRLEIYDLDFKPAKLIARSNPIVAHADFIAALAFTPDGKALVTGSSDKSLKFWDVSALTR